MRAVNLTRDQCTPTITARYGITNYANFLSLAHFPMPGVIIEYNEEETSVPQSP